VIQGFKFAFETKKQATCWPEFIEAVDPKLGTAHVLCKHCKTSCRHPNRDASKSTSNLHKHLDNCHKHRAYLRAQAGEEPIVPGQKDLIYDFMGWVNVRRREVMTTDRLKEKVLRINIDGNLSFSHADNPEFVELLKMRTLIARPHFAKQSSNI